MDTFKISVIGAAALLYLGTLGYSLFGYGGGPAESETEKAGGMVAPMVMYHDSDVDVYSRRSVRSSGARGGGIRGGK